MSDTIIIILFFIACGIAYWVIGSIGNKIVDKSGDAMRNRHIHQKNSESKSENLADHYRT